MKQLNQWFINARRRVVPMLLQYKQTSEFGGNMQLLGEENTYDFVAKLMQMEVSPENQILDDFFATLCNEQDITKRKKDEENVNVGQGISDYPDELFSTEVL